MDLEAFFRSAVPLYAVAEPARAVCYWWCRGVILRGAVDGGPDVHFELVEPDTPEMEELVRCAGPDLLLELYSRSPPPVL